MRPYTPMIQVLKPVTVGAANVQHFEITSRSAALFNLTRRDYVSRVGPGRYVRLMLGNKLVMSDTTMEKLTNLPFVYAASGDVLIAGLGIGLTLLPVCAKPRVTSVTVIERSQDVIDAVFEQIALYSVDVARKVDVLHADIFTWRPGQGVKYDTIYFDIWPDRVEDNLPQMALLHQRFKGRLRGQRWMDSWECGELRRQRRQRREERRQYVRVAT